MPKICSKCHECKEDSCFYSGKVCKDCKNKFRKSRAGCSKTLEYNKKYSKLRVYEYTEEKKEYSRKRYLENKSHILSVNKKYRTENKDAHRERQSKRRSKKLLATPIWLTDAQKAHIKRIYRLAVLIQDITGISYHVDHIIPLKGKDVCGLHTPENLQVLRADLNLQKSNSHLHKE